MALAHGGRIVPILAGQEQHDSTPRVHSPDHGAMAPRVPQSLLLDQQGDCATRRNKPKHDLSLEMPCLKERGLFALPTEGDGNCLYYSLSDQLYADFDHADQIRQLLADHIATHKRYFMQFVVAEGGERRRPRRVAASAYATRSADVSAPSEEDKERRFDEMVAATRKNGEWGSSEHLQAFCQVFRVDMNVYTMDGVQVFRDVNASPDDTRDVLHVAFHDFKHYSSVRVIDGCHAGLFSKSKRVERLVTRPQSVDIETKPAPDHSTPIDKSPVDSKEATLSTTNPSLDCKKSTLSPILSVDVKKSNISTSISSVDCKKPTLSTDLPHDSGVAKVSPENISSTTKVVSSTDNTPSTTDTASNTESGLAVKVFAPWDIQSIQDGLGGRYDHDTIVDMLQKCRGNIDRAFAALLGEKNDGAGEKKLGPGPNVKPSLQVSRSSSPFSTGSKRSADDSDDSEDPRPPVRRVRPKRHIVSNLTFGVGISFCDDQNEVVSLNLQMKADAEKSSTAKTTAEEVTVVKAPEQADSAVKNGTRKGPRRSGRLSKSRTISPDS